MGQRVDRAASNADDSRIRQDHHRHVIDALIYGKAARLLQDMCPLITLRSILVKHNPHRYPALPLARMYYLICLEVLAINSPQSQRLLT